MLIFALNKAQKLTKKDWWLVFIAYSKQKNGVLFGSYVLVY